MSRKSDFFFFNLNILYQFWIYTKVLFLGRLGKPCLLGQYASVNKSLACDVLLLLDLKPSPLHI